MGKTDKKYFLGSNTSEGFVSAFGESYDPLLDWKAYIIKGGPGTGKSSFMKYIAKAAKEKGYEVLLCPCSSDPNSLDGVIIPQKKIVIMDGTSPHTVDPKYPGVCEEILNFGEFWNSEMFENKTEIITVTNRNKQLHKTASRYMKALGQLISDNLKTAKAATNTEKAARFGEALGKKHIPKTNKKGKEWIRYLTSITPEGLVFLGKNADITDNTVIIEDEFGYAATVILSKIREYALLGGYEFITVKNGFLPSILLDGIIIPELKLSFLRECSLTPIKTDSRRIHSRRFTSASVLGRSRERIKFNKKAIKQLLLSAAVTLKQAKAVHDELEAYYIKAMDFKALEEFSRKFAEKIFE